MSSSSAAAPAVRSGVWDGSEVEEEHIEFLRQTRRLPSADLVRARPALEGEILPAPEEGERGHLPLAPHARPGAAGERLLPLIPGVP